MQQAAPPTFLMYLHIKKVNSSKEISKVTVKYKLVSRNGKTEFGAYVLTKFSKNIFKKIKDEIAFITLKHKDSI